VHGRLRKIGFSKNGLQAVTVTNSGKMSQQEKLRTLAASRLNSKFYGRYVGKMAVLYL